MSDLTPVAARIAVDDLAAARRSCAELLGLPLRHDGNEHGYLVFDAGGFDLAVEAPVRDDAEGDRARVGRFTGLSLAIDDRFDSHARLSAAGVLFSGPPEPRHWGGWLATFYDRTGNTCQLVQHPAHG